MQQPADGPSTFLYRYAPPAPPFNRTAATNTSVASLPRPLLARFANATDLKYPIRMYYKLGATLANASAETLKDFDLKAVPSVVLNKPADGSYYYGGLDYALSVDVPLMSEPVTALMAELAAAAASNSSTNGTVDVFSVLMVGADGAYAGAGPLQVRWAGW